MTAESGARIIVATFRVSSLPDRPEAVQASISGLSAGM
jgi:hypothetical protein